MGRTGSAIRRGVAARVLVLLPVLALLGTNQEAKAQSLPAVRSGIGGQVAVHPPRGAAEATVDGFLNDPAWSQATLLTGFSQYRPVDGRPADDSTQVLVWYSPTAIYFGIRAFEAHGTVHATLADRDHIQADDYVLILLDTFHDTRRAIVLGVNPLGIQSDGVLNEGAQSRTGGLGQTPSFRDTVDLTPNFLFQSKGRLTEHGYEVEVRVPLKGIRFPSGEAQTWGLNVQRKTQHSGYEDTWAPVRQATPSLLAQSGTLEGLRDLRRGLVLELNPETTSKIEGAPAAGGWDYGGVQPEVGGNLRWGVASNLNLNATINPDFSQVEADVQQVSYDPRSAVFFPETRPFFVEGSEQFQSPNQLIYSRRIVSPLAAAKLSGKLSGTDVGLLSAVDYRSASATGQRPVFNLLRLRRDLGRQSTAGVVYTDRIDGTDYNRVAALDAKLVFADVYSLRLQVGEGFTRTAGANRRGPVWEAVLNRSGRHFSLSYTINGLHPDFQSLSGFVRRRDVVNLNLVHRLTLFGRSGGLIESWTGDVRLLGNWYYRDFFSRQTPADPKLHFTSSVTLRGGWVIGATFLVESFAYDPGLFVNARIERVLPSGSKDTIPYPALGRIPNIGAVLDIATPRFARFSANANVILSQDEDFLEWSPAFDVFITAQADWRPTERLRVSGRYVRQQYLRRSDWTTVQNRQLPRLKIEYQLWRPIFIRLVAQYDSRFHDTLRDDTRTNFPILYYDPIASTYTRAAREEQNDFRVDWLFSYRPTPGTVLFLGYGISLTETEAFTFRELGRVSDGFFAKLSYLFRL